jgi:hypothetical protein
LLQATLVPIELAAAGFFCDLWLTTEDGGGDRAMHFARMGLSAALFVLICGTDAIAAPFCAVASYGRTQCHYYDIQSCRNAAGPGGGCAVNQQEQNQQGSGSMPFCTVDSYGRRECFYADLQSCQIAGGSSVGCVINPNQVQRTTGGAPFCVIGGFGTNCIYFDLESCRRDAATLQGACVTNSR